MDKKALTPELKAIYERVMTTPTRTEATTQASQASIPPPPPAQANNSVHVPPPPPAAASSASSFTSVSPRALNNSGNSAIVFSNSNSQKTGEPHTISASRSGNSKALPVFIGFLVVIFIVMYTFIWMVVFKLVSLPF